MTSDQSGSADSGDSWPGDDDLGGLLEPKELNLDLIIPNNRQLPRGVLEKTDAASAHLVAKHYGTELRFSMHVGWIHFDGRRFVVKGKDATCVSLCIETTGRRLALGAYELYRRAAQTKDEDAQTALKARASHLRGWAQYLQSAKGIANITKVLRAHVEIDVADLDRDPSLLTCENGTLDLRTGVLRGHRPSDLITKLAPVRFDPAATCPLWDAFIAEILPADDVREFVHRFLGYALTGSTREQCFVIALGKGANGKSVLAETVRSLLGDYTRDSPTDTFMQARGGRGTENDIARLRGARFVTAKETEEDQSLDEARVKQVTGEDTVTARFLFHEHFEFIPSFKLWLYCNHRPKIKGVDDGIWRRVMLVLFDVTIPPERRDPNLKAKLLDEAPGIFAWLVRGCLEWQQSGLQAPESVVAATAMWRAEADEVRAFVAECCVVQPYATVKSDPLFARYKAWAQANGNNAPLGIRVLKTRLEGLGHRHRRTSTSRIWDGIGLSVESDDEGSSSSSDACDGSGVTSLKRGPLSEGHSRPVTAVTEVSNVEVGVSTDAIDPHRRIASLAEARALAGVLSKSPPSTFDDLSLPRSEADPFDRRPLLPCLTGDLIRWWRDHPDAYQRDLAAVQSEAAQ